MIIIEFPVPNTLAKVAFAFCVILTIPASSYARATGSESTDQPEISDLPSYPENAGGMSRMTIDPSGVSNASRVNPTPKSHLTVLASPTFQ
jgi:hypothetical protein